MCISRGLSWFRGRRANAVNRAAHAAPAACAGCAAYAAYAAERSACRDTLPLNRPRWQRSTVWCRDSSGDSGCRQRRSCRGAASVDRFNRSRRNVDIGGRSVDRLNRSRRNVDMGGRSVDRFNRSRRNVDMGGRSVDRLNRSGCNVDIGGRSVEAPHPPRSIRRPSAQRAAGRDRTSRRTTFRWAPTTHVVPK